MSKVYFLASIRVAKVESKAGVMYKLMLVIKTRIVYLFIQRIEISESIIWDVSAKGLIRPRQRKLVLLVK